jgi:hypothetical protein
MIRLPELYHALPGVFAASFENSRPWTLLDAPLEALFATLPSAQVLGRVHPGAHLVGDRIVLGKGSRIAPGAVVEGPIWIGEDVEIRVGAYLRGGCWVGDNSWSKITRPAPALFTSAANSSTFPWPMSVAASAALRD